MSEKISKAPKRSSLQNFIPACIKENAEWVLQKHSTCTDQCTEINIWCVTIFGRDLYPIINSSSVYDCNLWSSLSREVVKPCVLNCWQMRSAKCLKALQKADLRGAVAWMWWHSGVSMSQFWPAFWQLCWCRNTEFTAFRVNELLPLTLLLENFQIGWVFFCCCVLFENTYAFEIQGNCVRV